LEKFGYTAVFIGFSFAIPTLIYASTGPLVYILTSKIRKRGVIFLGYALLCLSCFVTGPSKLLGIYNSPAFIIFGLAIMGFGAGMIIIPVLPEMIEAIEEEHPDFDEAELHNIISGLFISF
jgi:MFS family permease